MIGRIFLIFFAGIGLTISLLFAIAARALQTKGVTSGVSRMTGLVLDSCGLDGKTCGSLLTAPSARILGIPNYAAGIVFYLFVIVLAAGTPLELDMLYWALLMLTTTAVFLGAVLIFILIFVLKTTCPLCFAAHAINFFILATLILYAL